LVSLTNGLAGPACHKHVAQGACNELLEGSHVMVSPSDGNIYVAWRKIGTGRGNEFSSLVMARKGSMRMPWEDGGD